MKTSTKGIEQLFSFSGLWGVESKCGLTTYSSDDKNIVIVTELYQDNPGSSVTSMSASLAMQIAQKLNLPLESLRYFECNPDMNSKLSFYENNYFEVKFDIINEQLVNPRWRQISESEKKQLLTP